MIKVLITTSLDRLTNPQCSCRNANTKGEEITQKTVLNRRLWILNSDVNEKVAFNSCVQDI